MNKNGVFDTNYSLLTEKQMDTYRDYERQSKSEGCPKYVGYLSFDNKFLVDNGLMIGEVLDRAKLMDIARKGINSLIDKSNKLKMKTLIGMRLFMRIQTISMFIILCLNITA